MKPTRIQVALISIIGTSIVACGLLVLKNNTQLDISQIVTTIGGVLGAIFIVIASFTTILDWLSDRGIIIWKTYTNKRNRKILELIQKTVHEQLCQDDPLLTEHQNELLTRILSIMGLTQDKYQEIPLLFRKLQYIETNNEDAYKEGLMKLCLSPGVLKNLSGIKKSGKKYPVKYYIDLTDVIYNNFLQNNNECLESMAEMIRFMILSSHRNRFHQEVPNIEDYEIENSIHENNYKIAIPENGNLLLGLKVASVMKLNIVRFIGHEKYLTQKQWEGDLNSNENVIIIHDVLCTGTQIINAIKLCQSIKVKSIEIYSLITRHDHVFDGQKEIEKAKIPFNCLLFLDDAAIELALREVG